MAVLAIAGHSVGARSVYAQTVPPVLTSPPNEPVEIPETPSPLAEPQQRYALIVMGLPGDHERRQRYRSIVETLRNWLGRFARVTPQNTLLLTADSDSPPNAEALRQTTSELMRRVGAEDALWVFTIGHGSVDKRSAWFHLPGPDLNDAQWADLFATCQAQEQVFWFTHSGSGRFVKSLSRPGRVVMSATDPEEVNETRFPVVLADVMGSHLLAPSLAKPDPSNDPNSAAEETSTGMSVLELFRTVCKEVDQQYQSESLVPTEHAQLDDNGDGTGTESPDLSTEIEAIDGGLASRIIIPVPPPLEDPPKRTNSSETESTKEDAAP